MRIDDKDIPDGAVAMFHPDKRVADSLFLVAEERVLCRPPEGTIWGDRLHRRAPEFEYVLIGGSVGWFAPNPEIGYPGVPGFLGMFFLAGLIEHTGPGRRGWAKAQLTQAGEFLFAVWRRDRERATAKLCAEQDQLDAGLDPRHF